MREIAEQRLCQLNQEMEAGRRQLAELEERRQELQHTLYRISGAIQVLEEILRDADPHPAENNGARQPLQTEDA